MAQIGEEIASPAHGRIIFRTTSEESEGELLELDAFLPPERDWHDAHYHPSQEERYQVA